MKSFFLSLAIVSIVSVNCLAQKTISVDDIWSKYAFMPASAGGFNAMKDGLHYTDLEKEGDFDNIVKYELKSGKKLSVLVKGADVKMGDKTIDISGYSFSPDETKLFFATESEGIYRRSSVENNYVYDLKTGKTTELSANGKQMFATFSPVGNKVAFVRQNNLFIKFKF